MIKNEILIKWGAVIKSYKKNEIIFSEGEHALFYFQILEGNVRMFNSNEDGKELTHGYFSDGQSFGEPPLFIDADYPASALCILDSKILKINKQLFFKNLAQNPEYQNEIIKILASRILNKTKSSKDIINQTPKHRVLSFLYSQKKKDTFEKIIIPFTRQEIANFIGLRVETVIRVCSQLNKEKIIEIKDHKIYF